MEGAVAAAVAAGLGDSLPEVAAAARGALAGKAAQLAPHAAAALPQGSAPSPAPAAAPLPEPEGLAVRLTVSNALGLHARPAALLVRTAAGFDAEVTVADLSTHRGPVNARSMNAVATLGVRYGDEIVMRASGRQAREALAALRRLAAEGFGDPATQPSPVARRSPAQAAGRGSERGAPMPPPPSGAVVQGLPGSPGRAVGKARLLHAVPLDVPDGCAGDPAAEWAALQRALAAAADDIRRTQGSLAARAGDYEAAIFGAHLLFLEDEALLGPARAAVLEQGRGAARAWADAVAAGAAAWEALDDAYLRARAADLRAVGDQVLRHLLDVPSEQGAADGARRADIAESSPSITVAADLTAAETAALDPSRVRGLACAFGGPTSHSAILARALGIPAVVGAGRALLSVAEGTVLMLDGESGTITVDPPASVLRASDARRAKDARESAAARARAGQPAVTRDGVAVKVTANIAAPGDVAAAVAAGADGVGLLRTEFLFLASDHLPAEDEQERAYRAVAEGLGGRPFTLRTLDAGADKQLPYLPLEPEQNPFLGLRGIRLGLRHPELLAGQLRAALRVAAAHPLRIMFPMVSTVEEVRRAGEILATARESLVAAGVALPERVEVGIMVEVPATALMIEAFVPYVDFFSLGTNDLAQYVLAADRGNSAVAALADALHPAVLRLIDRTARAAAQGGRGVAVCGEVAGEPLAIPLLVGLGVTELSMAAARIPLAKQTVRDSDAAAARQLAEEALDVESAAAVRRLARRLLGREEAS